jgi:hypothetical protein
MPALEMSIYILLNPSAPHTIRPTSSFNELQTAPRPLTARSNAFVLEI